MINHYRCLLLNTDGSLNPGASYPGEEYVPPDYRSVAPTPELQTFLAALYGPDPDRAAKNLRLRQLTTLWHAGELAPYVTEPDPRITYWPRNDDALFRGLAFGAAARRVAGDACALTFQGSLVLPGTGRIYQQWLVEVLGGNQVRVTRRTEPTSITTSTYTLTGGLSNAVTLPGSGLSVVFATPGASLPSWEITVLTPVIGTPASLVTALELAGADRLFGAATAATDATLRAVWQATRVPAALRLAAVTLALARRMDETYQQG